MKNFFLTILLCSPLLSPAQSYEFGLNGGLCFNTQPSVTSRSMAFIKQTGITGYSYAATAARNFGCHWQAGAGLDFDQVRFKQVYSIPILGYGGLFNYKTTFASPAASLGIFINYKANFKKSYFYFGFEGGPAYSFTPHGSHDRVYENASGLNYPNGAGIMIGAHIGYKYSLSKRLAVSAAIAARYYGMNTRTDTYIGDVEKWSSIAIPCTVGVHYCLKHKIKNITGASVSD